MQLTMAACLSCADHLPVGVGLLPPAIRRAAEEEQAVMSGGLPFIIVPRSPG